MRNNSASSGKNSIWPIGNKRFFKNKGNYKKNDKGSTKATSSGGDTRLSLGKKNAYWPRGKRNWPMRSEYRRRRRKSERGDSSGSKRKKD